MSAVHQDSPSTADVLLDRVREMVLPCLQCGTCSGSCPNEFAMDYTPRRLWRLVLSGDTEEVFNSRTFALCSACYSCTLRCPRELPLTEAMAALKQAASRLRSKAYRPSLAFYENFVGSVRRRGRVNEMEFMTFYFLARMNPVLPLRFTPLGIKFMIRGKVTPTLPGLGGSRSLEPIFKKIEEMEAGE